MEESILRLLQVKTCFIRHQWQGWPQSPREDIEQNEARCSIEFARTKDIEDKKHLTTDNTEKNKKDSAGQGA